MSERRQSFGGRRGFGSRLTARAKLAIVGIVCGLIGIEIGFILSTTDPSDLRGLIFSNPAEYEYTPLIGLIVSAGLLYICPYLYWGVTSAFDFLSKRISFIIGFLMLSLLLFISFHFAIASVALLTAWVFLLQVLFIMKNSRALIFFIFLSFSVVPATAMEPILGYLFLVLLMGFGMYPEQISLKRFLFPRRGAL